jgi:hypothetical protein
MNELTAEWVEKAEGDYATAGRELRARRRPNYDAACFHAQQTHEIERSANKPSDDMARKWHAINDEERKAFHAREYVITDPVAEGLRWVVINLLRCNNLPFAA